MPDADRLRTGAREAKQACERSFERPGEPCWIVLFRAACGAGARRRGVGRFRVG
jgi:hypothetical protein